MRGSTWQKSNRLLRTALGPGVQAYGPTEQLLQIVTCELRTDDAPNRYCERRARDARVSMLDRLHMAARESA